MASGAIKCDSINSFNKSSCLDELIILFDFMEIFMQVKRTSKISKFNRSE